MSAFWKAAKLPNPGVPWERQPSAAREVPHTRQSKPYYCGVAVVKSLAARAGYGISQKALARLLETSPEHGTDPRRVMAVLKAMGIPAVLRREMPLEELRKHLDRGAAVVLIIQDWGHPPKKSYADSWDDGHYVIALEHRGDVFVLEDPAHEFSGRRLLTASDLEDRWHDKSGTGERYIRAGIVVERPSWFKKEAWEFRLPQPPPAIDILKLRKQLAALMPKRRDAPTTGHGVLAACTSCGWSSSPVDSRETLEEDLEEMGEGPDSTEVVYGGAKLQANCPRCYNPLHEEAV